MNDLATCRPGPPIPVPGAEDNSWDWLSPAKFAVLLGLFIFVLFPDVVLGTRTFIFRDFGIFSYPLAQYHRESFWRGEVPLWNPLNNCGIPFLAQWNTMVCYPFSLFYLLLPLSWALGMFCLLHLFLAGMGMYVLAYRWTNHRLAAGVAGLGFAFNGMTLNCLMWPHIIAALSWMPWIVWSSERAWQKDGGRKVIIAAVIGALQMTTGAPEIIFFTWLIVSACWIRDMFGGVSPRPKLLLRYTWVVLLICGLAAIQLAPFLDLLHHSQRDANYAGTRSSMPGWGWANFLVPLFRCYESAAGVFFQDGQVWTSSYYLGIGLGALALIGVVVVTDGRVRLLAVITAVGLVLALGEEGYLYGKIKQVFPHIGFMNFPIKFVLIAVFCVPLLAAFGIREFLNAPLARRARSLVAPAAVGLLLLVLLAGIVGFAWRYPLPKEVFSTTRQSGLTRAIFLIAMLGLLWALVRVNGAKQRLWLSLGLLLTLWLDVVTHAPSQNPRVVRSVYDSRLELLHQFEQKLKAGESRAMVSKAALYRFYISQEPDLLKGYLISRLALADNCNLLEAIPKLDGFFPLYLREERELIARLYFSTNVLAARLADFLSISQITAEGRKVVWEPRANYLPFVTAGQRPIFRDGPSTLNALMDGGFEPRQVVYLPLEARGAIHVTNVTNARITKNRFAARQIETEVEAGAPSLVVLSQTYYHPWKAYVDGEPTPLWRANYSFQAVQVPAGRHVVKLVYEDRGFYFGAIISGLTLAVCAAVWPNRIKGPERIA